MQKKRVSIIFGVGTLTLLGIIIDSAGVAGGYGTILKVGIVIGLVVVGYNFIKYNEENW